MKGSSNKYYSENIIGDSRATSHMVPTDENTENQKYAETRVTIGDSETLTGIKCVNWQGYQKRDGEIHHVIFSNKSAIPGLQKIYLT